MNEKAYQNFKVAMYLRAREVASLGNENTPFKERFEALWNSVKINKVNIGTSIFRASILTLRINLRFSTAFIPIPRPGTRLTMPIICSYMKVT
jgi:hypothetical protein